MIRNLLILLIICVIPLGITAQWYQTVEQRDSAKQAEYREKIGLDYFMPDFSVTSIDEEKMGARLANLLRFYEEVKDQGQYSRLVNSILSEQNEDFKNVYVEVKKQKLMKVEKSANEITITYLLWLQKNATNIKQTNVQFHFINGVSESQTVNEMFSNMSRYVKAREQLQD